MTEYKAIMTATCDRCSRKESVSAPVLPPLDGISPRRVPRVTLPFDWKRIAQKDLCSDCCARVIAVLGGE